MTFLNGYKTYLAAALGVLTAILQICNGAPIESITTTLTGVLGLIGLRHAIERKS
jgi:hypothetical protein